MTELSLKHFRKNRTNDNYASSAVMQIKIDEIRPNRAQPRVEFDNNSIIRLNVVFMYNLPVRSDCTGNGFRNKTVALKNNNPV